MISKRAHERNAEEALDKFVGSWALCDFGICWWFWFSMVDMMGMMNMGLESTFYALGGLCSGGEEAS